jgi:hypothetical protein
MMPEPQNVKQVKSFVASVGSYHKFIPNFSAMAEPLYNLQRKNTEWLWSKQCAASFTSLKRAFVYRSSSGAF